MIKQIAYYLVILPAFTIIAGCSSSDSIIPPEYSLEFISDQAANTGADLKPTPIKIRLYQLKSITQFLEADFFSLQENSKAVLGETLVDIEQFFLLPNQKKKIDGAPTKDIRYLGVVAEYQNLNGKRWRITLELPPAKEKKFYTPWVIFPSKLTAEIKVRRQGLTAVTEKDK